jgi:hypothetical protein
LNARTKYPYEEHCYALAHEVLRADPPSLAQLHRFIIEMQQDEDVEHALGPFISAGYQLLPEDEIVYDLDTPELSSLGMRLRNKLLIIDGAVGKWAGNNMIGSLVINGTAGEYAGAEMIGHLTYDASKMAPWEVEHFGLRMIGTLTESKTRTTHIRVGVYRSVPDRLLKRFRRDITNPDNVPYDDFYHRLLKRYI